MKKLVLLVGMATLAILMCMSFPSVVQADTISIQTLLSPMLLTELQSDNMSEQPTEHRSSWGAVKEIYRGVNPVPYSAERAESTAAVNRRGTIQPYTIGTRRNAVRNEFWYAMDQGWLYKSDDPVGPSGPLSNWHYLSKSVDANGNALRFVLSNYYRTCVSNDIPPNCKCCAIADPSNLMKYPQNTVEYWVTYLSNDSYSVRGGLGRGTQCVAFVAMLLYRATGGAYQLNWSWGSHTSTSDQSALNAQVGDIVYYNNGDTSHHIGVCVTKDSGGMTVGDSNYLDYETIGRHYVTNAQINGTKWRCVSGSGVWY